MFRTRYRIVEILKNDFRGAGCLPRGNNIKRKEKKGNNLLDIYRFFFILGGFNIRCTPLLRHKSTLKSDARPAKVSRLGVAGVRCTCVRVY